MWSAQTTTVPISVIIPAAFHIQSSTVLYIWSTALYGAETWTIWIVDQKYLESFETWCWRRMEKISWTDRVRNEDVLLSVKDRNILQTIKKQQD